MAKKKTKKRKKRKVRVKVITKVRTIKRPTSIDSRFLFSGPQGKLYGVPKSVLRRECKTESIKDRLDKVIKSLEKLERSV